MLSQLALLEIVIRSMNAGASLLIALALVAKGPVNWRHGLGALFSVSAGSYVIASSSPLVALFGVWFAPFYVLSICAGVFFWWFSLTLFDDGFRWRWRHFIPLAMTLPLVAAHFLLPHRPSPVWTGSLVLARMALIFGYGHAIFTALRYARDDLMEGRRRFRIVFAIAVAIMGLIVVYVETFGIDDGHPTGLMLLHAVAILILTFGLGLWLIDTHGVLLSDPVQDAAPAASTRSQVAAADRPAYEKLTALMDEGVWREDGLSVAGLASKVGVPEHHLRRLINGELGYRNFSAFLNSYRLEDAKRQLADPESARRQILQIALDVGFGSIAPFNRAFKEATGKTPTEFRKAALGDS
jgi:AraC-like DNA-binding protein